ncbi:cytochrome P450 9e2-like [Harpegnathos saltator]|uniref:cytochrome P450 9e2-like n=1 Tax=Harpegnathos saltator TaxID=610380 RepID=UPI00058DE086|nr:cytochrome P450 9e2-like [Harpegnathos saltator]
MVYVIALSLVAGALGLYYLLFKDFGFFKKHNIPYPKPLPLFGNRALTILRKQSLADFVKEMYNLNSEAKYVGMYDFTTPVIVLRDPELIKSITLKHFDTFPDHRIFIQGDQDPIFSKNLLSLRGDRWREVRTTLSPAFTSSKMKSMFKLMSDYAVDFANFVAELSPEQRVVEVKDILTRYTNDMIAICAFGVSVDSMRDPKNLFYENGKKATTINTVAILKFYMFRNLPKLARILKLKVVDEKLAKYFRDVIETTIRTRDKEGIVRPDMLQLMMESRGKKDGKMELTMEDMASQAFIFFFGGFESTATLMCFAAHEIAINEDIRKRLQDEIDQVLADTNGQVSYEAINNMEYLDAVVNEALRKYPVLVVMDRLCVKEFELPPTLPGVKPFTMKKGQAVWVPIYGLHHDPKYFKEPDKFDPERFLGEQKKQILNSGVYLPFGLGPRMCIGNRFALMETKVLLFHLLARCDLLPCEKTPIPIQLAKEGFIMIPEGGFWLKVVPRKDPHHTVAINNAKGACEL